MPTWIEWIVTNYQAVIAIVVALLSAVTGIALLIPGDQPEKTLQAITDFITKLSKK